MLDISGYSARIHDDEDRPLFDDAVRAAAAGAYRGAYVMIWLSCAESIKRRFREAEKRDGQAGKIVGEFEKKELDQKSVDKFIIEKAKEYGFVTETSYRILLNIYEMRCIYGHPYELAPVAEQVSHAASMVVDHVLSQGLRLRHGYATAVLKSLLGEKNFLDDQATVVGKFAKEFILKVDERIHGWFLMKYWAELEKIADDATGVLFFKRGIYFCRAMIAACGAAFTPDDWHSLVGKYPKILVRVVMGKPFFGHIGERAQDSLIGFALDHASERASVLQYIEWLMTDGSLSERQQERFNKYVKEMDFPYFRMAKLSIGVAFDRIIGEMKSHNWYRQRPAMDMIIDCGAESIAQVDENGQVVLGRNVLQVADGGERLTNEFLQNLSYKPKDWPVAFLRGIALECFVNEAGHLRLKCARLPAVLKVLNGLEEKARRKILASVMEGITDGILNKGVIMFKPEFESICGVLNAYDWAAVIDEAIYRRKDELITRLDSFVIETNET
jgi:hypothetical protein